MTINKTFNEKDVLESPELVNQAMVKKINVDHVIDDVIDAVFSIFECDRIRLSYSFRS